jgi:integrase
MVYRRKDHDAWFVAVPTRSGRVKRSTRTTHRATARAIERMLEELGPKGLRAWDLLDRVEANTLTLGTLFDAFRNNDLDGLRARLADVDLGDHVDGWQQWLGDRVKRDTIEHYVTQLRTLIVEGMPYPRSRFTATAIANWLASRTALVQKRKPSTKSPTRRKADPSPKPVSGATKRKYRAAAQSFAAYLVEIGVLSTNPVRDVNTPKQAKPRVVEIALADVKRIVDGAQQPYRALFALLYGAGVEISAALACTEADVDSVNREIRARGTKTHTRDRVARVAEWAWPYLEKHVETLMPGERLFRGLDRWHVGAVHRERLRVLALPHHRVHDARHFYAIRAIRAGTPYELVARQLGHANVQMVATIYGRFAPRSDERDRWEKIAAAQDAAADAAREKKVSDLGTVAGTAPEHTTGQTPVSDWPVYSRGGTRTHDPGIMSADHQGAPKPVTTDDAE